MGDAPVAGAAGAVRRACEPDHEALRRTGEPDHEALRRACEPAEEALRRTGEPDQIALRRAGEPDQIALRRAGGPAAPALRRTGEPAEEALRRAGGPDRETPRRVGGASQGGRGGSGLAAGPLAGQRIADRYRVGDLIAAGGNAYVYRASDERLERPVAVKVLKAAAGVRARTSFAREAKLAARLWHPNVVAVFDHGDHAGLPYLVMEYVDGQTLRDVLNVRRRLPAVDALRVCRRVLDGLAAAHRNGLVHRDVKPENVLVPHDAPGDVKVADFGLAQALRSVRYGSTDEIARRGRASDGPFLATVEYVAPEVVTTRRADTRSDVYSAGIMLYELLTGQVPFDGDDPGRVARRHVDDDVPPPSAIVAGLPAVVDDLVVRATRRDPEARPPDAAAFAVRVDVAREALRPTAPRHRAPTRRHPRAAAPQQHPDGRFPPLAIAALVVTLLALIGWRMAG
ncbi:MAG: protein kinase domain-containing protein [Stackebrandtia sp.]